MLKDNLRGLLLSRLVLYAALLAALAGAIVANYQCYVLAQRVDKLEYFLFMEYRYDMNQEFTLHGERQKAPAAAETQPIVPS